MKNKIAKNERNSINMMKSQHRSRIKMGKQRPKSSIKEVKPGGQVVGQQSIEQQLITYSDISKTLSWTFYKPSEPIAPAYNNAICAWTSDEKLSSFKDVGSFNKDRTPSRSSSVQSIRSNSKSKPKLKLKNTDKSNSSHHNRNGILEKSSKTSHAAHHALRRNKSATVVGCEIISNHREGFEPKLSASMSSGFSNDKFTQDPIKKQLSFTQEVQKIITKHEFNHFEDYIDHISHYKTTVSDRINQKFKELHAPAMQPLPDPASLCHAEQASATTTFCSSRKYPSSIVKVIGINDPVPPLFRKGSSPGQTKYESSAEHWSSKIRTDMSRNWHRSTGDRPDTPKLGKRRQTNKTAKCGAQYFEHRFQGDRKSKGINHPRLSKLIGPVCHGIQTPDHLPATKRTIRRPLVLPALRDKLL